MADTYFVGLIGNASATGAIGVVFPLMSLMQAIAFMFGHGSGNHMSRSLGAGDVDDAEKYASTGFFSAMGAGVLLMVIGLVWTDPIVRLLGATETIAPYARDYVRCLMPGTPFLICSFVLNNQLRFQGSAFYGMIGITAGTILNIILDPVFIFVLDMQVAGAAIATAIGQAVSFAATPPSSASGRDSSPYAALISGQGFTAGFGTHSGSACGCPPSCCASWPSSP